MTLLRNDGDGVLEGVEREKVAIRTVYGPVSDTDRCMLEGVERAVPETLPEREKAAEGGMDVAFKLTEASKELVPELAGEMDEASKETRIRTVYGPYLSLTSIWRPLKPC